MPSSLMPSIAAQPALLVVELVRGISRHVVRFVQYVELDLYKAGDPAYDPSVTLDETDDEPARFWTYLVSAMARTNEYEFTRSRVDRSKFCASSPNSTPPSFSPSALTRS